jgi:hypothetical protein
MTGTDDARLPCVKCGALNPAGAEVCSGCGHRFDGTDTAPPPPEPPESEPSTSRGLARVGSSLGKLTTVVAIAAASIIAFVGAVFTTCSYDTRGDHILLDLGAGVAAALLVAVGLMVTLRVAGRRR